MSEILQNTIPYDPLAEVPLPGISPLDWADWLIVDEAYGGQMARREALLEGQREAVYALDESGFAAASELLDKIVAQVLARDDYVREGDVVTCPDGRQVVLDRSSPLVTAARLVQEDLCLLDKRGDEHVLVGAVLCFPASWMLAEKYMRPLVGIHEPVADYTDNIAKRVQRLFDGVRADRPLWRFNALWYHDPELFQPRSAFEPRRIGAGSGDGPYLRSEKQSILRLPESGAVVFSIHTFVVKREDVAGA